MIHGEQCEFKWDIHGRYHGVESKHLSLTIPEDGYDPNGNLLKINYAGLFGEIEEKYAYDENDQLVYEDSLLKHQYKNDSLKNRLSKDTLKYRLNTLNQIETDGNSFYRYDSNGNLISEECNEEKILYQYDALIGIVPSENLNCTIHMERR